MIVIPALTMAYVGLSTIWGWSYRDNEDDDENAGACAEEINPYGGDRTGGDG